MANCVFLMRIITMLAKIRERRFYQKITEFKKRICTFYIKKEVSTHE